MANTGQSTRPKRTRAKFPRKDGNTRGLERAQLQDAFIDAFASSGTILAAATRLSISRETVYQWIKEPEFAKKFADAQEDVTELCETAAMARGVNGVERFVISGGKPVEDPAHSCAHKRGEAVCNNHWLKFREYSDHMLEKLLEARRPEKYARRGSVELKVDVKIYSEVMQDILGAIRRNVPASCPHCKNLLNITTALAAEMENLSRNFEVRQPV